MTDFASVSILTVNFRLLIKKDCPLWQSFVFKGVAMGYLTIKSAATSEYTEKRSKFIGGAYPCKTEEEAQKILEEIKTRYWDARHNCYAYVVEDGRLTRFSDDGEPHGTAGKPILEVINGKGIVNVLVVVTRYFGGVLLGTGGLVRAYSKATKDALENSDVVQMVPCTVFKVMCEYQDHSALLKLLENTADLLDTQFTERVTVTFALKDEDIDTFGNNLTEVFSARLKMEEIRKEIIGFAY